MQLHKQLPPSARKVPVIAESKIGAIGDCPVRDVVQPRRERQAVGMTCPRAVCGRAPAFVQLPIPGNLDTLVAAAPAADRTGEEKKLSIQVRKDPASRAGST